ncbi:MAG: alpha/beta fold hydrolase [bacterium]
MTLRTLLRVIAALLFASQAANGQALDTLVEAGGSRLHFHIVRGKGIPILFESGGGDGASVWSALEAPVVAAITGTTLIMYDRAGFGRSDVDSLRHDLVAGEDKLDAALKRLGYSGDIMLVAHSLGGFYATYFASRHLDRVKAAVLIDGNLSCFATDDYLAKNRSADLAQMEQFRRSGRMGLYYIYADQKTTVTTMRSVAFPKSVPLTDFVSERTPFPDSTDDARWKRCHQEFAAAASNRRGVRAYGSGHYIFLDQQALVIGAIVDQYAALLNEKERTALYARSHAWTQRVANEQNVPESARRISERDINIWGYALLKQGEMAKALEVFRLNVANHPGSANVYDSLAETYEMLGDTTAAIRNYTRVLQLKPGSTNAADHLKKLGKIMP